MENTLARRKMVKGNLGDADIVNEYHNEGGNYILGKEENLGEENLGGSAIFGGLSSPKFTHSGYRPPGETRG